MDREIWRGKDVGYIVKKKMNRGCRKNSMVSVNRWKSGSVNRTVNKGEGKEMDQEIKQRIETLKKEKDAVILAHYYVDGEVQEIADYVGDSYYLAELATTVPQKTIIFCGVSFMGESAKILSPEKTVIMADRSADCPMAHMVEVEKILGYSILPTLVSLTGACGLRVIWIFTIFAAQRSLAILYLSYPISWAVTATAHMICFWRAAKKLPKEDGHPVRG